MSTTLLLLLGIAGLVLGGELLVRGAVHLAHRARLPSLLIGLTVVAWGTSAPELFVSFGATWRGAADLAVANVVGSNTFNVLWILGLCAIVAPLAVAPALIRQDVPVMIAASTVTWLLILDGTLSPLEGAGLLVGLLAYTFALSRREGGEEAPPDAMDSLPVSLALIAGGLVVLVFSGDLLVTAATTLAREAGVSEAVIGLTIVAAGTSLPELATSLVATWRGQRDIAVGNVIGSNIANLLLILGVCGTVSGAGLTVAPPLLAMDVPFMTAVALVCLPVFLSGRVVSRLEGVGLLASGVTYTAWRVAIG